MLRNCAGKWLLCLAAIYPSASQGQLVTDWLNGAGGAFDNGANWDLGVPGAPDEANFSNSYTLAVNPYTLGFDTNVTNSSAVVAGDNVTFDLDGNTYALSSGSSTAPSLMVVASGSLTLKSTGGVGALSTVYVALGQSPGDTGTLTVNDPNVNFTVAQTLWLGGTSTSHPGKGYLNINSGTVTVGTLRILDTEGTGVVNLAGGTLNVGTFDGLPTGFNWTAGTLNVTGSRLVMDGVMPLGQSLTLNPGMTLSTSGTGAIELYPGSTLNLNGGTFPSSNALIVDYNATVNLNVGTFSRVTSEVLDGNFVNNTMVSGPTAAGQSLTFTGSVGGSGSYTGSVTFNGNFAPGNSSPTTVSLQDPTFGAINNLQLKLNSASLMDHLDFTGTAVLGGALTVTLGKNFAPSFGQSFDFFDGSTTGSFASLNLPALPAGYAWNATQLYNHGVLSVGLVNRWLSPSNGNFNDPNNWSNGYAPPVSDSAVFNTSSATQYTVRFTSSASNDHIQIGGDNVVFDLAGNSYALSNTGTIWPSLLVGVGGHASLTLMSTGAAGSLTAGYAALGQTAGNAGSITINDPNVTMNVYQTLSLSGSSTAAGGLGVLNISAGTVNATTLKAWNTTGTAINLSGGMLSVTNLELSPTPSILNWTGGTLRISSGLGQDSTEMMANGNLPTNLTINSGMLLRIDGNGPNFIIDTGTDTLTVDGGKVTANSTGGNQTLAIIGELGPSNVEIKNSGTFNADVSEIGTAVVTVKDAGSQWNTGSFDIGTGSLHIKDGGVVNASVAYVGGTTANPGTVTLDGAGAEMNVAGSLYIGHHGSVGMVAVSGGGAVSDVSAFLGDEVGGMVGRGGGGAAPIPFGTLTITDSTSAWTTIGSVYVGGNATSFAGNAVLNIQDGMVSIGQTLKIWNPASPSVSVTVTLAGGALTIGMLDTTSTPADFIWTGGTLDITSSDLHIGSTGPLGSALSLVSGMNLQVTGASHSLILDSGSALTNAGSVLVSNMDITAGTYTSTGSTEILGGSFVAGAQTIGGTFQNLSAVSGPTAAGQFLTFTGDVTGSGNFSGNVAFAGSYRPDDPVSVMLDTVDFVSTNILTLDIGGLVQGTDYDYLDFTGSAMLGGTLDIQLIDGFTPAVGESFDLFDGSLSGEFAAVNLPALPPSLSWDMSRLDSDGVIAVVPETGAGWALAMLLPVLFGRRSRA